MYRHILVFLTMGLLVAGCAKRAGRMEESLDIVELREGGVLTRFKVSPTEGAMLWLDKRMTTGIVWDAALRAQAPEGSLGTSADGLPLLRTVLDWAWDGDVLRVNGAVAGARIPGASPEDVAAAGMIYHQAGCPSAASLAVVTDGIRSPGKVLVVDDCQWTAELFQTVAPRFRGLVLRGGALPEDVLKGLNHGQWTPSLLSIEGIPLAASFLPSLAPFSGGLVAISLKDSAIPFQDGSVEVFTNLYDLRFLDLSGTGVQDQDLSALARRGPPLEELRLSRTYLSAARLDKVSRMESLRALDLSNTRADSSTLARFDNLRHLRRLDLRATAVEDPGMKELRGVSSLLELDAPFWLTDASAADVAKIEGLRVLRLRAVRFRAAGLKELAVLDQLLFLELNHVDVSDEGIAGLLPAPNLEVLEVEHCPVGDAGMESMVRMPRLRKVEIEETNVGDAGLAILARAPALEVIKAQELPGITDKGMAAIPLFPTLVALVLDECELTDAAVPSLAQSSGLRLLSLEATMVSDEAKARLRVALPVAVVK